MISVAKTAIRAIVAGAAVAVMINFSATEAVAVDPKLEKTSLCDRGNYQIYDPPAFIQGARIGIQKLEREEYKGCQKIFSFESEEDTDRFIFAVFLSSEKIPADQRDAFAVFVTETFRKGQDVQLTFMPERARGLFKEFRFSVGVEGQSAMEGDISRMSFLDTKAGTLIVYSTGPLTVWEQLMKAEGGEEIAENMPDLLVRKAMYVKLWHNANLDLLSSQ